jgi:hypothetical protein
MTVATRLPARPCPPGAQDRVCRFRPYGPALRLAYTVLFAGMALALVVAAFFVAREVAVDGSRDSGSCVITRTYPLFGAFRERLPLAAIQGTRLRARTLKNGVQAYAVHLRTAQGETALSMSYEPAGRQRQQQELDAFLGNPGARSLHLVYDRGNPYGFLLCLASLALLLILWPVWQEATVRVQDWRGAVVLERRRWPLPPWTRTLPRNQVTGTRIATRGNRRRPTYRVHLVLATGEEVPLLQGWAGDRLAWYQRTADDLDRLIAPRA